MTKEELDHFTDGLAYYFSIHEITVGITVVNEKELQVDLHVEDEDDEDGDFNNFCIGNYADPGMHITFLGSVTVREGDERDLVIVNGLVFEAYPHHIVGWAVGYEGTSSSDGAWGEEA